MIENGIKEDKRPSRHGVERQGAHDLRSDSRFLEVTRRQPQSAPRMNNGKPLR